MNTLGWLFILGGALVVSSVLRGRVADMPKDISDIFLALVTGDKDALGEALTRRGDGNEASVAETIDPFAAATAKALIDVGTVVHARSIATAAVQLGSKAKGYRWTATGPDYYDCSGLMWRACQQAKVYSGPRFTTATFKMQVGDKFAPVVAPAVGDIVLWVGHMGVVVGPDRMYSARSVRSGIGESSIRGHSKSMPRYFRAKM